jgi:hypothetical protein
MASHCALWLSLPGLYRLPPAITDYLNRTETPLLSTDELEALAKRFA